MSGSLRQTCVSFVAVAVLAVGCSHSSGRSGPAVVPSQPVAASVAATPTTISPPTTVPPTTTTTLAPDTPFTDDPAVRRGTLPNGLHYYVRSNGRPGKQVDLRLAVNAGSAVEDSDQAGVAHFLEHMLFNGTSKYPKNDLIAELQGRGAQFGADINAYTSLDETVYRLSVPNDDDNVDKGLDILREWLTAATITPTDVTEERGVVLDEWRSRTQTTSGRISDAFDRVLFTGSDYQDRQPIGNDAAIQSMTPALLRRFYDRWYRPDNASVVLVGEIDVAAAERKLTAMFSDVKPHGEPGAKKTVTWTGRPGPQVETFTDPDIAVGLAEVLLPVPAPAPTARGVESVERDLAIEIALDVITTRLNEDVKRGGVPFTAAVSNESAFARAVASSAVSVSAEAGKAGAATAALLDEFARVEQFGFTKDEVDHAIARFRTGAESAFRQADTRADSQFADAYVANFLSGMPLPSAQDEYTIGIKSLDALTVGTVKAAFDARLQQRPRLVVVNDKAGASNAMSSALAAELGSIATRSVPRRADLSPPVTQLLDRPNVIDAGSVQQVPFVAWSKSPSMITFSNGARVIVQTTPVQKGRFVMYAIGPGGLAAVPLTDVPTVWLLNEVIGKSGFGDLDPVQVDRLVSAHDVSVGAGPSEVYNAFSGSAASNEIELAMQLVHQYIAAPKFGQVALDASLTRNRSTIDRLDGDPDRAAEEEFNRLRYNGSRQFPLVLNRSELDAVKLADFGRLWTKYFGDAGQFVFVLVGDLDVAATLDLARAYIGTLPGTPPHDPGPLTIIPPPSGVRSSTVRAGTGDTASVRVGYAVASDGSVDEAVQAAVFEQVLNTRLTRYIREQLGASYSPASSVSVTPEPVRTVVTRLAVTGAPQDMERLTQELQGQLRILRTDGPSTEELAAAVAEVRRHYNYTNNGEIAGLLLRSVTEQAVLDGYFARSERTLAVTLADLVSFAKRTLPAANYIQVVQLPK